MSLSYSATPQSSLDQILGHVRLVPSGGLGPVFEVSARDVDFYLSIVRTVLTLPDMTSEFSKRSGRLLTVDAVDIVPGTSPGDALGGYHPGDFADIPGQAYGNIYLAVPAINATLSTLGLSNLKGREYAAVFAHEYLHSVYGPHSWTKDGSLAPNNIAQVISDPETNAENRLQKYGDTIPIPSPSRLN